MCDLGFAFLRIGTGTQNKVFDYIKYNLPVVVTSRVFNGLTEDMKQFVTLAHDLDTFIYNHRAK